MKLVLTIFSVLYVFSLSSQVIITDISLPDVGDALEYTVFDGYTDTLSYRSSGENMEWELDNFIAVTSEVELYQDISISSIADSFPDADMLIEFGGFESAAERTDTTVAIVGIVIDDFTGLGIELNIDLDEPFKLRSTPFEYGDTIEDFLEIEINLSSSIIPGLDSIDIGIPGTTIDSIRVTTEISKREEATGWGTLTIMGQEKEVLQIREDNSTNTIIEVGVNAFGIILWLDASEFLGDMGGAFGGNQETRTYKFMTADDKRSVVEFEENTVITDTLGTQMTVVNGRTSAEFLSNNDNIIKSTDITISPNPCDNYIVIKGHDNKENSHIAIFNMNGQLILEQKNVSENQPIDISMLKSGKYILQYKNGDTRLTQKLIVIE